jgi:hypothetical protein
VIASTSAWGTAFERAKAGFGAHWRIAVSRPAHAVNSWLPAASIIVAGAVLSAPALGARYYGVGEVQKALFSDAAEFVHRPLTLTPEQRKKLVSGFPANSPVPGQQVWEARSGETLLGFVVIDQVIGKHDLITYATGLGADGRVRRVEIMEYRESYGYEVRNERWLRQFAGKSRGSALQINQDIQNISGATMSCEHVSAGVRRVLLLYDMFLKS